MANLYLMLNLESFTYKCSNASAFATIRISIQINLHCEEHLTVLLISLVTAKCVKKQANETKMTVYPSY